MKKLIVLLVSLMVVVSAQLYSQKIGSKSNPHVLAPSAKTVAWGHYWSETPPVLYINSGDRVRVHTLLTSNPTRLKNMGLPPEQIEKELIEVQSLEDRGPGGHVLTGPIYIEEAEPGDVLEIKIHTVELAIPYGYNAIGTNGFLSDEIFERKSKLIYLDIEKMTADFTDGIVIPLKPFFGSMGVAPPKEAGRINSAPPWIHAGNLDNKELVAGTTLFIPVHVKGALFQIGDGHAAQGNGEVDITAIETSLRGELEFIVHKNKSLKWPIAETDTHIITMGTNRNLTEATKIAVREMIAYLMSEKKLSREDAYMLCSLVVDLNITQLVDGNKGVHAMLPKEIFFTNK